MTYFEVDTVKFGALGDRVLIEEDQFKSGYDCTVCSGTGSVLCADCAGRGIHTRTRPSEDGEVEVTTRCNQCGGAKKVPCTVCKGKGALLVVPDTAQRRPSTGTIVSAGRGCTYLKEGQKVVYSNFSGHTLDLERAGVPVVLRILHESEVLAAVDGHLELRVMREQTEAVGL